MPAESDPPPKSFTIREVPSSHPLDRPFHVLDASGQVIAEFRERLAAEASVMRCKAVIGDPHALPEPTDAATFAASQEAVGTGNLKQVVRWLAFSFPGAGKGRILEGLMRTFRTKAECMYPSEADRIRFLHFH